MRKVIMPSRVDPQAAATAKWLSVVGIGEDGVAGLGTAAQQKIAEAEIVFGGERHLALAGTLIRGAAQAWPTPFDTEFEAIRAHAGKKICVLASGDPFLFGVGASLSRVFPAAEMTVLPAPSSFSLAASRLGWALQDVETVSLHGRPLELLRPLLQPGRRVIALTSDEHGPAAVAAMLAGLGFGPSRIAVLEALGGALERVSWFAAHETFPSDINRLNLVGIELVADKDARPLPLTPGLDDALFETDGQITKREVRAMTLAALAPRRGELLWDIGAGSGSIAIEWMLADPSMRAIAIEGDESRAARISRNAKNLGVPGLKIVHGTSPEALRGLTLPQAIFIGGGGSEPGVTEQAMAALRPLGRLVANAVTLEMESVLLALHAAHGGSLTRLAVTRAEPIGGMLGWRPAMPVTQWSWVKP